MLFKPIDYPLGSNYSGDTLNNKPHGKGSYTWPNGDKNDGDWENGIRHVYQ